MTRYAVSAFGVIHKSEYAPGKFAPLVAQPGGPAPMRRGDRADARDLRLVRANRRAPDYFLPKGQSSPDRDVARLKGHHLWQNTPKASTHDLADTFKLYGYTRRHDNLEDISGANEQLKKDFDVTRHRPSKVHPNISYGHSITPKMEAGLDKTIDPKLSRGLKHTVVYHHDPKLNGNLLAAAIPAHPLTAGRGHVVLGSPFVPGWKAPKTVHSSRRSVVNHELIHASDTKAPWQTSTVTRNMGDEAKADATSGANAYRKNHIVYGRRTTKVLSWLGRKTAGVEAPQVGLGNAYNPVHQKVTAALKRTAKLRKI